MGQQIAAIPVISINLKSSMALCLEKDDIEKMHRNISTRAEGNMSVSQSVRLVTLFEMKDKKHCAQLGPL